MDARVAWARRLALVCVAMSLMLMVLGAWVKATGSGLSCPGWPSCYGQYLPPFPSQETGGTDPTVADHADLYTQAQVLYEWAHRAVVALLVVPLIAWTVATVRKPFHPALKALPATALGLYFFQAFLGAVTVNYANAPWATTAHLATAAIFFGVQVAGLTVAAVAPLPNGPPRPEVRDGRTGPGQGVTPRGMTSAPPATGFVYRDTSPSEADGS